MGREHIRNLKLFPEAQVTALIDPVQSSLDKTLATLGPDADGARCFPTVEAMIAARGADAVLIVSPNFTHRAVLEPLMATNLAILCEKPLCTTVADARWAAQAAAARSGAGAGTVEQPAKVTSSSTAGNPRMGFHGFMVKNCAAGAGRKSCEPARCPVRCRCHIRTPGSL